MKKLLSLLLQNGQLCEGPICDKGSLVEVFTVKPQTEKINPMQLGQTKKLKPAVTIAKPCGNGVLLNGPSVKFGQSPQQMYQREVAYYKENERELEHLVQEYGVAEVMTSAYINGFTNGSQCMQEALPSIISQVAEQVQESALDMIVRTKRNM